MYKILFSILFFMTLVGVGRAADRPHQEIKLTYKAYWGGFVISKVYSHGQMSADAYQAEISYKVTGLASIFSNMENKVSVRGMITPEGILKPHIFENQGSWGKNNFKNRTEFRQQDSKIITHEYTFKFKEDVRYIPVKDPLKYGPDMVSFYLGLTLDEAKMTVGPELKHQNIFGGFFLLDISYRCLEHKYLKSRRSLYRGQALVCEFQDKVIDGGFERIKKKKKKKKKSKKKDNEDTMEPTPLHIWYAKLDQLDHMIPVYSEFPFGWGKVRVYLSDIAVTTREDKP